MAREDNTGSEALNRRAFQDQAIVEALAAGRSYREAGAIGDVTDRTVARRMSDPAFARRVWERRQERFTVVTGLLAGLAVDAVGVARECLLAGRPADRLRAANLVLTLGLRFRHDSELDLRFAEIERRLGIFADAVEPEDVDSSNVGGSEDEEDR